MPLQLAGRPYAGEHLDQPQREAAGQLGPDGPLGTGAAAGPRPAPGGRGAGLAGVPGVARRGGPVRGRCLPGDGRVVRAGPVRPGRCARRGGPVAGGSGGSVAPVRAALRVVLPDGVVPDGVVPDVVAPDLPAPGVVVAGLVRPGERPDPRAADGGRERTGRPDGAVRGG
ncbi:hypothetical protein GCM10018781_70610 [Kitasatospora indigofera]|uniref:Uncharacterized protein n=1 Tax=Kitasatospora indigofera TaxID=67307 RepID=A0A919GG91_9ACTN|nr:hypothetical protein GCM10018781_70610 [Kitasatospora indigofera]